MKWVVYISFVVGAADALAQGTFQDLDFEEAKIVPISGPGEGQAVTVANALPGWTVNYDVVGQTQIYYNSPSTGATAVTLNANGYPGFPEPIPEGNYSVFLQGGGFDGTFASPSISQTGLIPAGSSVAFVRHGQESDSVIQKYLIGSDVLTLFPVRSGTGIGGSYEVYER